jgi:hypothetical protein
MGYIGVLGGGVLPRAKYDGEGKVIGYWDSVERASYSLHLAKASLELQGVPAADE